MTDSLAGKNEWLALTLQHAEPAALYDTLVAREDEIKDRIRMIATNNGLVLPFVNIVLNEVGLGTPLTPTEKEYQDRQLAEFIQEGQRLLQEQFEQAQAEAPHVIVTAVQEIPDEVLALIREQVRAEIEAERDGGGGST